LQRLISSRQETPRSPPAGLSEAIPRKRDRILRRVRPDGLLEFTLLGVDSAGKLSISDTACSASVRFEEQCRIACARFAHLVDGRFAVASDPHCAAASHTSLNLRQRYSLTAAVENDDARADEFCALAENQAGLNGFNDGEEAKPVINRFGNPTVSPRNVAQMNISMPI
jgi:hypothetical protein